MKAKAQVFLIVGLMFGAMAVIGHFAERREKAEELARAQMAQQKQQARRDAMTPEERAAEDQAKADAKAAAEAETRKREQEAEAGVRLTVARTMCQYALQQTLNDPDSAKLESTSSWFAEERKDGTILVQPSGRAKNAFGAYMLGAWNCVVKWEGDNVRLLSLEQIRP